MLARAAYINDNSFDAHVRRGTLDPAPAKRAASPPDAGRLHCRIVLGGHPVSRGTRHGRPQARLSTATRFPNVDELKHARACTHLAVFANGHPDLEPETIWNASVTTGLRTLAIEAEASVYGQRVDDYIYCLNSIPMEDHGST